MDTVRNKTLLESAEKSDAYGFRQEFRKLLSEKLSSVLAEQSDTMKSVMPIAGSDVIEEHMDPEWEAVNQLEQQAKMLGASIDECYYEEGTFCATLQGKQQAKGFFQFLDNYDLVDSYEADIIRKEHPENEAEEDFDFDTLTEKEGDEYEFYVYLLPDIVSFADSDSDFMGESTEGEFEKLETLSEVKRILKVNFRGARRYKMQCHPGYKWDAAKRTCLKITGAELAVKRKAIRRAKITKKAAGASYRNRVTRKTRKALRFRKAMGR